MTEQNVAQNIWDLAQHEFMMGVYGVIMLHFEKFFRFVDLAQKNKLGWRSLFRFWKYEWDDIVRSLFWLGVVIAFDDDILSKYNSWAEVDVNDPRPWMYFVTGFGIDRIIVNIKKKTKFLDRKIDIDLYR